MELLAVVHTVVAFYICVHTVDMHNAVTDELCHVTQQDSVLEIQKFLWWSFKMQNTAAGNHFFNG